jgi:hypothetical protein
MHLTQPSALPSPQPQSQSPVLPVRSPPPRATQSSVVRLALSSLQWHQTAHQVTRQPQASGSPRCTGPDAPEPYKSLSGAAGPERPNGTPEARQRVTGRCTALHRPSPARSGAPTALLRSDREPSNAFRLVGAGIGRMPLNTRANSHSRGYSERHALAPLDTAPSDS